MKIWWMVIDAWIKSFGPANYWEVQLEKPNLSLNVSSSEAIDGFFL